MTFEEDAGIDSVHFSNCDVVEVSREVIEKRVKVIPACRPSIIVMIWGNTVKIIDIWLHLLQWIKGILFGDFWNRITRLAKLYDVVGGHGKILEAF